MIFKNPTNMLHDINRVFDGQGLNSSVEYKQLMNTEDPVASFFKHLKEKSASAGITGSIRGRYYWLANKLDLYRGQPVYENEWDLLVILDACRVDALSEVASEYDFLPTTIESRYSVGSASDTWMQRTFVDKYEPELRKTVYVTSNPNSEQYTPISQFKYVDEVWKTDYDSDLGTIPPRAVTDHSIVAHRECNSDRLIAHYMQPHFPSVPQPLGFGLRMAADNPDRHEWIWSDEGRNKYTKEEIWNSYLENLRYVLDNIKTLLNNVDAEQTVITADHGNAFGEWGVWGHPHQPHPKLRKVPWVHVTASDEEAYHPDIELAVDDAHSAEETLRALGYKE
jgi:hypothetical protein